MIINLLAVFSAVFFVVMGLESVIEVDTGLAIHYGVAAFWPFAMLVKNFV